MTRDIRVPLFWYLTITLAVPLLNGAAGNAEFWQHAITVLAVSLGAVLLRVAGARAAQVLTQADVRHAAESAPPPVSGARERSRVSAASPEPRLPSAPETRA